MRFSSSIDDLGSLLALLVKLSTANPVNSNTASMKPVLNSFNALKAQVCNLSRKISIQCKFSRFILQISFNLGHPIMSFGVCVF